MVDWLSSAASLVDLVPQKMEGAVVLQAEDSARHRGRHARVAVAVAADPAAEADRAADLRVVIDADGGEGPPGRCRRRRRRCCRRTSAPGRT